MSRLLLGAGVLALILPVAGVGPVAAQEECSCFRGEGPMVSFRGPEGFSFRVMQRARIGIGLASEDQEDYFDVGALITEVTEDSPAEDAGLEVGDVILSVDGQSLMEPVSDRRERWFDEDQSAPVQRLLTLASAWEPGEEVTLEILRDGDEFEVDVTPEELDLEPFRLRMGELEESLGRLAPLWEERVLEEGRGLRLRSEDAPRVRVWSGDGNEFFHGLGGFGHGLELTELNDRLGSYFGADEGVLVTDVSEDSTLGLEPGDVIVAIDGREVDSPQHVRRILGSYDHDEEISFQILRDGGTRSVSGTLR